MRIANREKNKLNVWKNICHKTKEHWRTHRKQNEGILLRTSLNTLGDKVPHLINSSSTLPQKERRGRKKKGLFNSYKLTSLDA